MFLFFLKLCAPGKQQYENGYGVKTGKCYSCFEILIIIQRNNTSNNNVFNVRYNVCKNNSIILSIYSNYSITLLKIRNITSHECNINSNS